jgi:hypothetical protein
MDSTRVVAYVSEALHQLAAHHEPPARRLSRRRIAPPGGGSAGDSPGRLKQKASLRR